MAEFGSPSRSPALGLGAQGSPKSPVRRSGLSLGSPSPPRYQLLGLPLTQRSPSAHSSPVINTDRITLAPQPQDHDEEERR